MNLPRVGRLGDGSWAMPQAAELKLFGCPRGCMFFLVSYPWLLLKANLGLPSAVSDYKTNGLFHDSEQFMYKVAAKL